MWRDGRGRAIAEEMRAPPRPTSADVARLAVDAPDAASFERALLALIACVVEFDAAFVETKGAPRERAHVGMGAVRVTTSLTRAVRYDLELAPVKRVALMRRGVAVDTAVLGESAVRATAYHRDFAAPVCGKHSLLAWGRVRGREVASVVLGRTGSTFGGEDIARVEELLPTIALSLASFTSRDAPADASLTPRERDVLGYLCLGYTNREIALACGSSPNTVRNQVARVFAKLGASTRAEAVALALRGT